MTTLRYAMRMGAMTALGLLSAGAHCGGDSTATPPDPTMPSATAPQLTAVSPALGPTSGNTTLTIDGANFKAGMTVQIGATMATGVTVVSDTKLTATLPAQPTAFGKVPVVVAATDGQKATRADLFSYYAVTVDFAGSTLRAGGSPNVLAVGDLNGDGKMDVVVGNQMSKDLTVMLSSTSGVLVPQAAISTGGGEATALAIGDLDGDGKPDLAFITNGGTNVNVLAGKGNGSFAAPLQSAAGTATRALLLVDLNGDKKLDAVVVNEGKGVSVLLGTGDGKFGAGTPFVSGALPNALAAGDFNGDGKLDILVSDGKNTTGAVLPGSGDGKLGAALSIAVGVSTLSVVSGDFNGDGKLDAVFLTGTGVLFSAGSGTGTFATAVPLMISNVLLSITAGDFNGDGLTDLAVADVSNYTAYVSLGSKTGLGTPTTATVGNAPLALAVGDFDGDQRPDIVSANQGDNGVTILTNKAQ